MICSRPLLIFEDDICVVVGDEVFKLLVISTYLPLWLAASAQSVLWYIGYVLFEH